VVAPGAHSLAPGSWALVKVLALQYGAVVEAAAIRDACRDRIGVGMSRLQVRNR
jgi:hypothetical protein